MQANPMVSNILITLLAEPPTISIAKESKKFPAGIIVPVIVGWLFHMFCVFLHFSLWHVVVTCAVVPNCLASTNGFGTLQCGQTLNNSKSGDKKPQICLEIVITGEDSNKKEYVNWLNVMNHSGQNRKIKAAMHACRLLSLKPWSNERKSWWESQL